MTDDMLAASKIKLIHIPTVLGAVVPVYNVPGVSDLNFSADVLADIYLGKISNWNDARIAKDNPGVKLPDQRSSSCIVPTAPAPASSLPTI